MLDMTGLLYENFRKNLSIEHQETIVKFFLIFARFEFLLKFKGCINKSDCTVNWACFTKRNRATYEARLNSGISSNLKEAIDYILQNPPKKLISENGKFKWKAEPRYSKNKLHLLSLNIRIIRNNLFHGNKDLGGDNGRDKALLQASLIIISDWVIFLNGKTEFIEEVF